MADATTDTLAKGLTSQEVQQRVAAGDVNVDAGVKTARSAKSYVRTFARCSIWST